MNDTLDRDLRPLVLLAVRIVLGAMLAGSVFVQAVMVPLLVLDLQDAGSDVADRRIAVAVIVVLGIGTVQVTLLCVWRLVGMVRAGTVFSERAFRAVDLMVAAAAAAALLAFALAVVLAPGEAVAPGVVLLVCGASLFAAGVGLVVFVLRMLLAQAISTEAEAVHLRAELEEVI